MKICETYFFFFQKLVADFEATVVFNFFRDGGRNQKSYVTAGERKVMETFLEANSNLTVIKADKGNSTVIMEKADYNKKLRDLLEDPTTYKKIDTDPTSSIQRKNNEIVKKMFENSSIELSVKKSLTNYNSVAPRIYGLPKVHKPGAPLRPIVSFVEASTYSLSKFLANIMSCVSDEDINIRNAHRLITRLQEIKLEPNDLLVSLDAVSLFTSIPVSLALHIIEEKWTVISNYTSLNKEMFFNALKFCLSKGYCKYDDTYYAQIEGVAMVGPLSFIAAEFVLDKLFKMIREKSEVKFIVKYVDDSLAIINKDNVNDILERMNCFHDRLKFTCEKENDGAINFLDITIFRTRNYDLSYKHYKKPTYTGRIINFHSNLPFQVKVNTAKSLLQNWLRLSDISFHNNVTAEFIDLLSKNDYPPHFINLILSDNRKARLNDNVKLTSPHINVKLTSPHGNVTKDNFNVNIDIDVEIKNNVNNDLSNNVNIDYNNLPPPPPPHNVIRKKDKFFSIPYVGPLSNVLKKHLKRLGPDVRITFSSYNQFNKYFSKLKDKVPQKKCSGLVYRIQCKDCKGSYVGETIQWLENRLAQHSNDVKLKKKSTALCEHSTEMGHMFDFEGAKILCFEENERKRKVREAIEIIKQEDAINFKTDISHINGIYSPILSRTRTRLS